MLFRVGEKPTTSIGMIIKDINNKTLTLGASDTIIGGEYLSYDIKNTFVMINNIYHESPSLRADRNQVRIYINSEDERVYVERYLASAKIYINYSLVVFGDGLVENIYSYEHTWASNASESVTIDYGLENCLINYRGFIYSGSTNYEGSGVSITQTDLNTLSVRLNGNYSASRTVSFDVIKFNKFE